MMVQAKVFLLWLSLSSAAAWTSVPHGTSATTSTSRLFSAASFDSSSDNYNYKYNSEGDHLQRPGAMQYDTWNTGGNSGTQFDRNSNYNYNYNYIPPRPPTSHWQQHNQDPYPQPYPQEVYPPQNYNADGWQAGPPTAPLPLEPASSPPLLGTNPMHPAPAFGRPTRTATPTAGIYGSTNAPGPFGNFQTNNPSTVLPSSERQGFLEGIQRFEQQAMAVVNNNGKEPSPDQAATREFLEETFGRFEQSLNLRLNSNRDIYDDLWDEANRIYQNLQRMDTNQKLDYLLRPFRTFLGRLQDGKPNLLPSANSNSNNNYSNNNREGWSRNSNSRSNPGFPTNFQALNNNNNNMGMQRPSIPNNSMGMQRPNTMNTPNQPNTMGMPNQPNTFSRQPNAMGMQNPTTTSTNTFQRNNNQGFNNNNIPNPSGNNMPSKPNTSFQGNPNQGFNYNRMQNSGMQNQPNNFSPTLNAFPNNNANNNKPGNNMPNSFSAMNGNNQGFNNNNNRMPNQPNRPNLPNQPNAFSPTPNAFPGTTPANNFTPQTEGRNDSSAWQ